MTLNTFTLLVAIGLVLPLASADNQRGIVNDTEGVRRNNISPFQHGFKEMSKGVHGGFGKMGSGPDATGSLRGMERDLEMEQRAGKRGFDATW